MIKNSIKENLNIHHIVFTISDLTETEQFYTRIFGQALYANSNTAMYQVGQTMLIFIQKEHKNQLSTKFDPSNIGLDHVAFGVKNLSELEEVEKVLNEKEIKNSGIHIDDSSKKEKIWLNDPSNIRIEFYL
ncbi:VOC family protein [Maribacter sp. X9]|uniref:VOC family protein n=1 Tax=Maribacter sp. X9 TaxID=3402159 RepID=UPI003AF39CD2